MLDEEAFYKATRERERERERRDRKELGPIELSDFLMHTGG